jgi:hypothetical protein
VSAKEPKRQEVKISLGALAKAREVEARAGSYEVKRYEPPQGVVPPSELNAALAMDSTPYSYLQNCNVRGGFPGYPFLSELAQLPEYRKIVTTMAREMTRKWVRLRTTGEDDKTDKIKQLDKAMRRYKLRALFREMAEHDGYFGRGQLYIEVNKPGGDLASDDPDELQTPLFINEKKIKKGALVGFRAVEAVWTYPGVYQSTNPLKKNFYKPESWYVMGNTVHDSRLLGFVSRPVPDLLKASYNFGGLSMSQLAKPYIDHWLRTRDSVSDLVHSFSTSGIATDMSSVMLGGTGEDLFRRIDLYNQTRDNRGALVLNKDTEEFFQFNTPLSGLDHLQAQAQEQMASVSSIPLVKLLGITPTGLNASSDGEIRVFYDDVHAACESLFRDPLKKCLDLIQLSEFGEIDEEIDFEFLPLYQLSELEQATARKAQADTDAVYIQSGVIGPEEVRNREAADPESPYHGLDLNDDIEDQDEEEEGEPTERADTKGVTGS